MQRLVNYQNILLWLALKTLRAPGDLRELPAVRPMRAFRDGMIVNLTNPKVILFVLAFVPQFVDTERGSVLGQFLVFGSVLAIGGFLINGGAGAISAGLGRQVLRSSGFDRTLRWITASLFGLIAVRLATEK